MVKRAPLLGHILLSEATAFIRSLDGRRDRYRCHYGYEFLEFPFHYKLGIGS